MQLDIDRLNQYHEAGKLRRGKHPDRDLFVWCYSVQTVYTQDWDDLTLMCRGLQTDAEGNVLARPFPKFFNWGQPQAPGPEVTGAPFWAYDKEDGTLIIVGLDSDGEALVSTKGSFTTWHSEKAREMLGGWKPVEGSTAVFEFIHPDNRIVVDYGGRESLVLLGAVANEDGCDHFQPEQYADESGWFGDLATPRAFNLQSMLQTVQDPENGPNREGFVLIWPNPEGPSHRAKIKFAQYIHLHAVLSRISNVSVWEALRDNTLPALLEIVPDEIYDKVRETADELIRQSNNLHTDVMGAMYSARSFEGRKAQAEWILKQPHSSLIFAALDGKDIWPKVWATIKPERDESWTFLK